MTFSKLHMELVVLETNTINILWAFLKETLAESLDRI